MIPAVLAVPFAAAAPCDWHDPGVPWVEYCESTASGVPVRVRVENDLVYAFVGESERPLWDGQWYETKAFAQVTHEIPYVGESFVLAGYSCVDADDDGDCERMLVDVYAALPIEGPRVAAQYWEGQGWTVCAYVARCHAVAVPLAPDVPPRLP